jgi:hypothetical protein
VIEAGMEGALNEALLERALVQYERLGMALEQEEHAAAQQGQVTGGADDLIDFGEDSKPPAPAEAAKPIAVHAAATAAAAAAAPTAPLGSSSPAATPSDDAFSIFGPSPPQQPQLPQSAGAGSDSAVLAEADRLLQELTLKPEDEGKRMG